MKVNELKVKNVSGDVLRPQFSSPHWSLCGIFLATEQQTRCRMWSLPVIHRNLNVQLLHQEAHHIVTLPVNLQLGRIIFWRPLEQ